MFDVFAYSFMTRALLAGIAVAFAAPILGIFLVARRYSLVADTLSHVALLGVAIGFLTGAAPIPVTAITTVVAAFGIERMRGSKKFSGENVLALFLFGSLALASILISKTKGFGAELSGFLFGSITTVSSGELYAIVAVSLSIVIAIIVSYKELFAVSLDEEAARASGIKVNTLNLAFTIAAALMIALSIRIVGALLIGALMVIPIMAATLFGKSFKLTTVIAVLISVASTVIGLIASYYFGFASGGAIVVSAIMIFVLSRILNGK